MAQQYAVMIFEQVAARGPAAGGDAGRTVRCRTGSPSRAGAWSPAWRWSRPGRRRRSAGAKSVTDAPFIETKEVLGGIFVLEARDLDHALTLAAMTPIVDGGVEVRPLVGFQVVD